MIIVVVIFLLLAVGLFFAAFIGDESWSAAGMFCLVVAGFATLAAVNISLSSKSLTGYIYSSSNNIAGYTTAHIRFSENAGTDNQPEFCVKKDSDAGRQIAKYVGSGKKVKVEIPAYFYLSNNPFVCGTTNMTIKEV